MAIVEHPFAIGTITAPHRHTHEDEHSIVLEGQIGFRSDDSEVVLGPGGYITKPRGQMHAMWNAGNVPGRIIEVITPGSFETYFRELGELLAPHRPAVDAAGTAAGRLHETTAFAELAARYGLTYGNPAGSPTSSPASISRHRLIDTSSHGQLAEWYYSRADKARRFSYAARLGLG